MEAAILLTTFTTTLAVVDPPGVLPAFLPLTRGKGRAERFRLAASASITMLVALTVVALIGASLLDGLGLSIPAIQVGGGALLMIFGLQMALGKMGENENEAGGAVVPIGIPVLAGPGSITVVLLHSQGLSFAESMWLLVPLLMIAWIVFLTLYAGEWIADRIKDTGVDVLTRLMGLMLTTIAAQLVLDGIKVGLELGVVI